MAKGHSVKSIHEISSYGLFILQSQCRIIGYFKNPDIIVVVTRTKMAFTDAMANSS